MIIPLIILFLLLFVHNNKWNKISQKKKLTDFVKYVLSIIVVMGHLLLFHSDYTYWSYQLCMGGLCVAMFLFFSGYGLTNSLKTKGDDALHRFLPKRLGRVLIPLFTAYLITLPVYYLTVGNIEWGDVLVTIWNGGAYLCYTWYVTEIVVVYVLFFFAAKYTKSNAPFLLMVTGEIVGIMLLFSYLKLPIWFVYSLPPFLVGVYYQIWEEKINKYISGKGFVIVIVVYLVFIISFRWSDIGLYFQSLNRWRYVYLSYYVSEISFVLICSYLINRFSISCYHLLNTDSRIIRSYYEVYLVQNCCVLISTMFFSKGLMLLLCSLLLTIAIAFVMNILNEKISRCLLKNV